VAFAIEGFQAVSQNHISKTIASNFYPKLTLASALGAITIGNNNKKPLEIGRPKGEILAGKNVSPAEKLRLGTVNEYRPRIQRFETSNSKWMGKYDTMPTVSSPTTTAHSQANQATARFMWADLATPILIWHEDKIRASQESTREGQAIAMSQLIEEATEVAIQEHIKEFNAKLWNGDPTSQSAELWDQPSGILNAISASGTYGNVNRAVETSWQAKGSASAFTADITKLVDDMNLVQGLRTYGQGVDLIITNTTLYPVFKAQVLASGGVILQNGMPNMAEFGVKQEVLKKDNAYIMYDVTCPASTVLGFTLGTWRLAFHPQRNFSISKFTDLSQTGEGAKDADQAFIRTRLMFSCDNPALNCKYSAVA
jgi:hypothetical protein